MAAISFFIVKVANKSNYFIEVINPTDKIELIR